ncbi:MAG: FAD-dependent oxidoreductase [Clostridiales Family XIII bacterium]|jgi:2,4-dienoyl-CoA reductase-like NADH-dependent reductase (Old Yellow Enzyme family)/NADPH-dependent 2,4-dienoyl-CoA reductase/sulfur reductase-like enzyme|nr:FAD-dependent oxidoreductase [Clostridiales Family XIII bacterium]
MKSKNNYPHLFSPIEIGDVTFKNRIWTAPAGVHLLYGAEEYPSDAAIAYYADKAVGGSACVAYSCQNMDIGRHDDPIHANDNIFGEQNHRFYRRLTDAVHFYGAKISLELLGFAYHEIDGEGNRINYSVNGDTDPESGEESVRFTKDALERLAGLYADAAEAAVICGFDLLLIHGGHGLILSQFLSPVFNMRTDEFGGSFENRIRFPLMVLEAIRSRVGRKLLIEYRISGSEFAEGGWDTDDCAAFLRLTQKKYIDIAHISAGSIFNGTEHIMHPTGFLPSGCNVYLADAVRHAEGIEIPVLTLGGLGEPSQMEEIISSGKADIIAMARGTICDAHLPEKARLHKSEEIIPCMKCFHCLDYARNTAFACSANPRVGRESTLPALIKPPKEKKRVVVIGGGPAGMQAALTATSRGHDVILLERSDRLGGKLVFSEQSEFKSDLNRYLNFLIAGVQRAGVDIRTDFEADTVTIEQFEPDAVIAAIGAEANIPDIPGIDRQNVITAEACYQTGKAGTLTGQRFAVLGGGLVGCETALYLAKTLKKDVVIAEMTDEVASEEFWLPRYALLLELEAAGVNCYTKSCCKEITDVGLICIGADGEAFTIEADTIVLSAGMKPRQREAESFREAAFDFAAVGDCVRAANVRTAVRTAFDAASQL